MEGNLSLCCNVWRNKWTTLVASFFVMSCAGALYSFSIYSQKLKTALHYDQETVSTIGFFKDLGANIGILAGILYDLVGGWLVLLLAAAFNMIGYMLAWAAVTGRISKPEVWQMCAYLWIGASSGAFASTAIIVTCVKNFPRSRGIVIGLLKGFVGLSGAMLTQIYRALYGEDPASFMLVVAWFPSFVFVAFAFVVKPLRSSPDDQIHEKRNFYIFLVMAMVLAVFLMAVIVAQRLIHVSKPVNQALMAVMVLILSLPLLVVVESEWRKYKSKRQDYEKQVPCETGFKMQEEQDRSPQPESQLVPSSKLEEEQVRSPQAESQLVPSSKLEEEQVRSPQAESQLVPSSKLEGPQPESQLVPSSKLEEEQVRGPPDQLGYTKFFSVKWLAGYVSNELRNIPERGKDHSVLQALVSLDLWIVFFATTAGLGSGLMAIDNMGQLGSSLGYSQSNISTFVSLLSIWNFFGRVGFGFLSEGFLQKYSVPRPAFLALVLGIMAAGHLYIALGWPGALYLGSIVIGMCFGAQMPVMFAIISEIFGLRYFGTLYNVGILASPLGTYLLSVKVAGHLYDKEAEHQKMASRGSNRRSTELLCHGSICYRDTLFIMAGVCMFGCFISSLLAYRTRDYYRSVGLASRKSTQADAREADVPTTTKA